MSYSAYGSEVSVSEYLIQCPKLYVVGEMAQKATGNKNEKKALTTQRSKINRSNTIHPLSLTTHWDSIYEERISRIQDTFLK